MRTLAPAIALAVVFGWIAASAAQDHPATPAAPPMPSVTGHDAPPQAQVSPAAAPKPPAQAQTAPAATKPADHAQAAPPPAERIPPPAAGRYSFQRVDDGFLRFDHASGQVAYCSARSGAWACLAVPENRAALEQEVARLQDVVAALQKEIAALREPSPPRPPASIPSPGIAPPPAAAPDKNGAVRLPSEEDIARARAYISETWRRLVDMIDKLQRDMTRKREDDSGLSRT